MSSRQPVRTSRGSPRAANGIAVGANAAMAAATAPLVKIAAPTSLTSRYSQPTVDFSGIDAEFLNTCARPPGSPLTSHGGGPLRTTCGSNRPHHQRTASPSSSTRRLHRNHDSNWLATRVGLRDPAGHQITIQLEASTAMRAVQVGRPCGRVADPESDRVVVPAPATAASEGEEHLAIGRRIYRSDLAAAVATHEAKEDAQIRSPSMRRWWASRARASATEAP